MITSNCNCNRIHCKTACNCDYFDDYNTITIWIFKYIKSEGIELKKKIHFWYDNLTRNKNIGDNYFDLYTFNDFVLVCLKQSIHL